MAKQTKKKTPSGKQKVFATLDGKLSEVLEDINAMFETKMISDKTDAQTLMSLVTRARSIAQSYNV